jgi:superfamily II DNA or RNA helicase
MVKLRLDNRWIYITGAPRSIMRELESVTSYRVAGFMFAPSFKKGYWDGKEHLMCFTSTRGYHAPRGLAVDIARTLRGCSCRYVVEHCHPPLPERRKLLWESNVMMRGYQDEAINALLAPPVIGCGVLKMPIRSGKTKTAARLINKIGLPTLFVVPSKSLLYQIHDVLAECFPMEIIGIIGDSECDVQFITVASIQTLASWRDGGRWKMRRPNKNHELWLEERGWECSNGFWRKGRIRPLSISGAVKRELNDSEVERKHEKKAKYSALLKAFPLLILDECHHYRGTGEWYKVPHEFDSRFKVGLSATAYMDNATEQERGIIWLKATCGPICYDVTISRLISDGYLMKQHVKMFKVTTPDLNGKKWSSTMRQRAIVHNKKRNMIVAKCAEKYANEGRPVAIIARLHEHIANLCEAMDDIGLEYRTITGRDDHATREDIVDGLINGDYHVIIGTVIGEGVDIPQIEVVINAEGGKDVKTTVQRQRNLTINEGKKRAVLVDFLDETNEHLRKHSESRLEVYRSEPMFQVDVYD